MRAFVCSMLLLVSLTAPAAAQDAGDAGAGADADAPAAAQTQPDRKRLTVESKSLLDGDPTSPNALQYFLWERLNHFRLRVDSLTPTGAKNLDGYIAKISRWWEKEEPNGGPASLSIVAAQQTTYNASEFYGQAQAHNFKGKVTAEVRAADGETVASYEIPFAWGRPVRAGLTKSQVFMRYSQMLQTALVLQILNHPEVRDRIPASKQGELAKWSKEQRDKLLGVLESSTEAMKKSKLAQALRDLEIGG